MNNCWYVVKPEIVQGFNNAVPEIVFTHPVEPGTSDGGWLKESTELQISNAKQAAGGPQKQFTREEIEKHNKDSDCWIAVNDKVYDATSVLEWHPGGKAAIMGHAGKVHEETSSDFNSVHDGYAFEKLKGCFSNWVWLENTNNEHRVHPWDGNGEGEELHKSKCQESSGRES